MSLLGQDSIHPRVMNAKGTAFALAEARRMGDGDFYRFQPPAQDAAGRYDIYFFRSELMVTVRSLRSVSEWRSSDNGDQNPCFCFHLDGNRQVLVDNDRLYRLAEPSFVAFYQPVEQPKHMIWQGGEKELSVTIAFSPDLPVREFGLHPDELPMLLQSLLPDIRQASSFLWRRGPLLQHVRSAAQALADPTLVDADLMPAYVKAKANELICLGLQAAREIMRGQEPPSRQVTPRYAQAAHEARRLIDESAGERLTTQTLARRLRVDPTNLCAAFSATVGETIFGYGNRNRMTHAKRMLDEGRLSIKQISHALGFSQPAAFSVAFKRCVGLTPDDYRRARHRRLS
ncbi:MAG: helix-turn-helix domain-containing protein [Parvibaculaceae bacterium]